MATRWEIIKRAGTPPPVVEKSGTWDSAFLKNMEMDFSGDGGILQQPYKKSDLVYICISTTGKSISQVPLIVNKTIGGKTKPLPEDDDWQQLFERPNIHMDRYSFTESLVGFLMLEGNVWIIPYPIGKFPPDSMWVVSKKFMKPIRDKGKGKLMGWVYSPYDINYVGGPSDLPIPIGAIPLGIDEVVHIWFWNPYDPVMGMAPIEAGSMNVITDYKAAKHNQIFFEHGATLSGILSTEFKLGNTQYNRARDQFEEKHMGYTKAHRIALLEQGLKYTPMGITQKDMDFVNLRKMNAERIYAIYGMKKAIVSVTEDVNYATSKEQRKEWWEGTNFPIMKLITSGLNFGLFQQNPKLKVVFDTTVVPVLQEGVTDKVNQARSLWQIGFTRNEINTRLGLGFDEAPWGDTWYMPSNVVPVDPKTGKPVYPKPGKTPPSAGKPLPGEPGAPKKTDPGGIDFPVESSIIAIQDEEDSKRLSQILGPIEERFGSKLSRVFFEMRKKVMELLHKEGSVLENLDQKSFEAFSDQFEKHLLPCYISSIVESIKASPDIEVNEAENNPKLTRLLVDKREKVREIPLLIMNQMHQYIKSPGDSSPEDRAKMLFEVARKSSSQIAKTELMDTAKQCLDILRN